MKIIQFHRTHICVQYFYTQTGGRIDLTHQ
jgi:hypothetical protein